MNSSIFFPRANYVVSASTGNFAVSLTQNVESTLVTAPSLTTNGGPVRMFFQSDGTNTVDARIHNSAANQTSMRFYRDSTLISINFLTSAYDGMPGVFTFTDYNCPAAAHVYSFRALTTIAGANTVSVTYCVMVVEELMGL